MPFLIAALLCLLSSCSFTQGYKMDVEIKGAENKKIYLGTYYGNQKLVLDSCMLNAEGKGVFQGKEKLTEGLCLIIIPEEAFFDIIINSDQHFSIFNDMKNTTEHLSFKGSDENTWFAEYQKSAYKLYREMASPGAKLAFKDSIVNLIKVKRQEVIRNHQGSFLSKILYAMEEPEIPPSVLSAGDEASYQYYKQHYFDHIDFTDDRMLQTPVLYNKLNHFFMQLCEWNPDTVTRYGLWLAEKAENSKYFFYYVFNHLYHGFSVSGKFNCDEAYVALIKKYLDSGKLWWSDDTFVQGAKMQLKVLEPTLAGNPAPLLSLVDTSRNSFDLSKIKSKWLLLFFWDPECSHCKSFYSTFANLASQPQYSEMTFVAVNIGNDYQKWISYIRSDNAPFIHTMSDPEKKSLLDAWNLFATPRIFVLDANRTILLKDPDPVTLPLYIK